MESSVEKILLALKAKCKMVITAPASLDVLYKLRMLYPKLPKAVLDLYTISDGVEINVTGTILFPADKLINAHNANASNEYLTIGMMSFGDKVVVGEDGKIYQIDHETGERFLGWDTLDDFLADELNALV